ncbi:hypothetical protein ONB71_00005 [Candidatus Purcelliella pentastirinorum]|uniref:Uncharacterized protein n=1 Tax=Candidatus Purcelliella pentastirinorum TaxID=472834 RepID=A0AAX3NAK1_9ENTR|nr:hypothetical protein [Candidatus Purcelliella pentastirinorum]WDI78531.1 hypothetical protein ONB71_00005 [Candidatus Purcelliella pentastirinorum]
MKIIYMDNFMKKIKNKEEKIEKENKKLIKNKEEKIEKEKKIKKKK